MEQRIKIQNVHREPRRPQHLKVWFQTAKIQPNFSKFRVGGKAKEANAKSV